MHDRILRQLMSVSPLGRVGEVCDVAEESLPGARGFVTARSCT